MVSTQRRSREEVFDSDLSDTERTEPSPITHKRPRVEESENELSETEASVELQQQRHSRSISTAHSSVVSSRSSPTTSSESVETDLLEKVDHLGKDTVDHIRMLYTDYQLTSKQCTLFSKCLASWAENSDEVGSMLFEG